MLGDHERHLARFLVRLVGRVDQAHAVLVIEGTRFFVVDVGQIGQLGRRVHGRRLHRGLALRAFPCGQPCRFVRRHGIAPQGINRGGGYEPRLR